MWRRVWWGDVNIKAFVWVWYLYINCAKHILDKSHSFGPIHNTMQILQYHGKGTHLNTIERYYLNIIFLYFADRASQYIYLNINQLDALNFIMSLFHTSTCFEHYVLIARRSKLYYTASGIIITLCRWPSHAQVERGLTCAPDGHLQSVMIPEAV